MIASSTGLLAIANFHTAVAAGWEDRNGLCPHYGIPAKSSRSGGRVGNMWWPSSECSQSSWGCILEPITNSGSLICAMALVNHYMINHTTGQWKLQGFALKAANVLLSYWPYSISRGKAKDNCCNALRSCPPSLQKGYALCHPTRSSIPNCWMGTRSPQTCQGVSDEFLKVHLLS